MIFLGCCSRSMYLRNILQLLPRRIDSGVLPVQCISVIQSSFYPAELSGTLFFAGVPLWPASRIVHRM
jgi:hypothetical protein